MQGGIKLPVTVDRNLCNGCKVCYNICPMDAFTWNDEQGIPELAYPEECWYCGSCYFDCPKNAIDISLPPIMM